MIPLRHRLSFASLLVLPLLCCSCSMLLVNTVPTKPGAALSPGASRQDLVRLLGHPQSSDHSPIPPNVQILRSGAPCVCDVYRVSGLVQAYGDPFGTDWIDYPAFFIVTLGLSEVVTFPYVAVDMTALSFQRRELRVWYDCSGHLVAWEKKKP